MADGIRVTISLDDETGAGVASVTANLGKVEAAAKKATGTPGSGKGVGGSGVAGLGGALGGLNNMLGAVGLPALGATAAIGALTTGVVASYKSWQTYAGQVRDVALITGTGAKESSKLLQVLDDYQISAEGVTAASRAMKDKGLTPTVETLASLSDKFLQIQDPAKRMQFVFDNFGRSGTQFINLLNQGGDAIREMGDDANKNLIMSDEQVQKAEETRLAMDKWTDTWEGWKVSAGAALGGVIGGFEDMGAQMEKQDVLATRFKKDLGIDFKFGRGSGSQVMGEYMDTLTTMYGQAQITGQAFEKMTQPLDSATLSYIQMAKAQAMSGGGTGLGDQTDYASLLKGALSLTKSQEGYADAVKRTNDYMKEGDYMRERYKAQQSELKQQLKDGTITQREYDAAAVNMYKSWADGTFQAKEQAKAMADLEAATDQQAASYALALMQQQEGYDPAKMYDFAAASGLVSKEAAEQQKAYMKVTEALGSGQLTADQAAGAIKAISGDMSQLNGMTVGTYIDVYIRTHGNMDLVQKPDGFGGNSGYEGGGVTARGGFASGGDVTPGVFRVGELGEEGLVMRDDGTVGVIPAGAWSTMKKWGVNPEGAFAGGLSGVSITDNLKRRGGLVRSKELGGAGKKKTSKIGTLFTASTVAGDETQTIGEVSLSSQQQSAQNTGEMVALLSDINSTLKRQPTKNDMANIFSHGQKTQV